MMNLTSLPLNGSEGTRYKLGEDGLSTSEKIIDEKTGQPVKDYLSVIINTEAITALVEVYRKDRGDNCNLTEVHTLAGHVYQIPCITMAILRAMEGAFQQGQAMQESRIVTAPAGVAIPVGTDRVPRTRVRG